ncbi:MAG: alkaline phosphatase [Ectothiorhodospiraceae bacterium]|nr:alkaline phosphatase [Ectothiorhodospiraceae bacterium]
MKHNKIILLLILLAFIDGTGVTAQPLPGAPKNIIIMIGDGMGYNQVQSANLYHHGTFNAQQYEQFPVSLFVSTYPARFGTSDDPAEWSSEYNAAQAWTDFDYVKSGYTDSAPAATSMATGKKTYSRAIGMDLDFQPIETLCEFAKSLGKSAGVVSSVQLSHATPAGFAAHSKHRNRYEEIARAMFIESELDVIMGCGNPDYDNSGQPVEDDKEYKYVGGEETWLAVTSGKTTFPVATDGGMTMLQDSDGEGTPDAWHFIDAKQEFEQLRTGDTPARVLGIPRVHKTLQQSRGEGEGREDAYAVPLNEGVPALAAMVEGALNVLDNDADGLFLMIEGGAIDWAGHANQPGRLIEEQQAFNDAVDAVIDWIERNGGWEENLLIITADHETGYLTGPKERDNSPVSNPLVSTGKESMPEMRFNSDGHTNQLVPLYAKGAGSGYFNMFADEHDPVHGYYVNNTEIAQVAFMLWGRNY